jgi:molybdopterin-guanine dinucleotide biosynthesis protein A
VSTALDSWSREVDPEWALVLACDLPGVHDAVRLLRAEHALRGPEADGVCLSDATGRPQWLTGLYRTSALRSAAAGLPDGGRHQPARALMDRLEIVRIPAPDALTRDIDTWQDLRDARARANRAPITGLSEESI